jgi:uncharacterized protein (TIGR00251 family)
VPDVSPSIVHPCVKDWQGGILLTVFVQPKASRTAWVGLHGDAVKIRIAASPVDGAANRELIRFLAEELSMPMSAIDIHSGACGRHKRVWVRGTTAVDVTAHLIRKCQG